MLHIRIQRTLYLMASMSVFLAVTGGAGSGFECFLLVPASVGHRKKPKLSFVVRELPADRNGDR